MDKFKDRLKKAMDEKRIRQIDLVTKVDRYCEKHDMTEYKISAALLNMYLKGKNEPKSHRIKILADILEVSEAWLCGFDVPKERLENSPINIDIDDYNKLSEKNKVRVQAYIQALLDSQDGD